MEKIKNFLNRIVNDEFFSIKDEAEALLEEILIEEMHEAFEYVLTSACTAEDIRLAIAKRDIVGLCYLINYRQSARECTERYLRELGVVQFFELLNQMLLRKYTKEVEENGSVK